MLATAAIINKSKKVTLISTLVFSIIIVLLINIKAHAAKETILLFQGYPPYSDGTTEKPKGLYPTLIKAIFKHMGQPIHIEINPWQRTLMLAKHGEGIIAGILKTSKRKQLLDYSNSFYTEKIVLVTKKNLHLSLGEENYLFQLKNLKIGALYEFSYGAVLDNAIKQNMIKIYRTRNDEINFQLLTLGRIDALLTDLFTAQILIKKLKLENQVAINPFILHKAKVYIATAKKLKKQKLLTRFNQSLTEMRTSGSYTKILTESLQFKE